MGDSLLLGPKECQDFGLEGDEEEDLDAFNDETFGGEVAEWEESAHEQLAQLTEAERCALQNSNDFFEFGNDDEGEALEPEPKANGRQDRLESSLGSLSLEPKSQPPPPRLHLPPAVVTSGPPPTLQYAAYAAAAPPAAVVQQQVLLAPSHFQPPAADIMQDPAIMSFSKVPSQPVAMYHSIPPQMGQPGPVYAPPPQLVRTAAHHHHQTAAGVSHPQPPPHISAAFPAPPAAGFPLQVAAFSGQVALNNGFLPQQQHHHHLQQQQLQQQHHLQQQQQRLQGFPSGGGYQQQPPLGFPPDQFQPAAMKTIQDVEKELLYGSVQQPPYIQSMNLSQRNLSYPGMRDRQQYQSPINSSHNHPHHQAQKARPPGEGHPHHQQQQRPARQPDMRSNYDALQSAQNRHSVTDASPDQADPRAHSHHQHHQHLLDQQQQTHHAADEGRRHPPQHGEEWGSGGYGSQQNQYHRRQPDGGRENSWNGGSADDTTNRRHQREDRWNNDESSSSSHGGDSWRWNENGGGGRSNHHYQDSATRRDLMPGHVHVLGILRHSRSRRLPPPGENERRRHDPDDDCLGSDAPLINPTGDPLLDAKLEQEQAELASRCRYFDETEDEYAGLMSQRDKQFIINIQLSQLKCDNPFIDDYYYTMFTTKKEANDDASNEPHFLLNESGDTEAEYVPTQFQNSLGRLQVVTVKAPRQIIDLGVMRCPDTPPSPASPTAEASVAPGATVVKTQAKRVDYKQVLLQIERLYFILLEVEALKLKLSAIPTGAPLREQVTLELTTQIQQLVTALNKAGLLTQILQVRKGRGLLSRCLSHLPGAAVARVCQEMTNQLVAVSRETCWSEKVWPHLARYISQASLAALEVAVSGLVRAPQQRTAAAAAAAAASPLAAVLASPLGINAILALLQRAATAAKRGQDKISVPVWREVITKLLLVAAADAPVAAPLAAPPSLDIGFLLTLSEEQMGAWDAFLATMKRNFQAGGGSS